MSEHTITELLSPAFLSRMQNMLGDEYESFLKSYEAPRTYGLRVNTAKISCDEFERIVPFPVTPIPWISNGYFYPEDVRPSFCPLYQAGLFYLQEPSAMTPASRLPVEPGDRVLDVCAAPGGKATELGAKLQGTGVLAANDLSSSRAKGLLKNLELFGIGNVLVLSEEPGKLVSYFEGYFDKILIDAPCSGEGMFRKELLGDLGNFIIFIPLGILFMAQCTSEQPVVWTMMFSFGFGLLTELLQYIAKMGTFSPEENEQTIEYLLQEYPEFQICEMEGYEGFVNGMPQVTESRNEELKKTVRIFPHRMKGEGHFLALLQKGEAHPALPSGTDTGKPKKLPEEFTSFLSHVHREFLPSRMELRGDKVYYMPADLPSIRGIRFLRTGLLLGELKKNRFEPSQAFAMNLKMEEYDQILNLPVSDERVIKYLKGDTLDVEDLVSLKEKGWYLVCVDGYPLGFGKLINQMLKNKYLPGWRWNG